MKKALASLILCIAALGLFHPQAVFAASSDDFAGNYVRRDSEEYNFLPLVLDPGVSTGGTGLLRDRISYNMAYDQGYEVQCAKPEWSITPQVYGAVKEYFERYSAAQTLSSSATYNADFSTGRIPLFRGDEDFANTTKISSFEGYFGATNTQKNPPTLNSSGVANVLLNQDGQCAAKYANLQALFEEGALCSKLSDPGQCVLNRDIEGAEFTTEELYYKLRDLFSTTNSKGENLGCYNITSGWNEDLEDFGWSFQEYEAEIKPAADALKKMPLNLDILYRLAFLVIAPTQDPNTDDDVFSFLQNRSPLPNQASHLTLNEEREAPIVIGFKVPFVATNAIYSLPSLRDSAYLTGTILRDAEKNLKELQDNEATRSAYVNSINTNKETKPIINCDGLPQCTGSGEGQALFQALIDLINGANVDGKPLSCNKFIGPYENAGDLGSPAIASDAKEYRDPYFSEVISPSNSAGFTWSLLVADENVRTEAAAEKVPVNAYLITPYGTNLTYITNSLKSLFGTEQFAEMVEKNCIEDFNGECGLIPEYFTFGGVTADLDSDSDSHSFIYDNNPACDELATEEEKEQCRELSFGANATEQPREPLRILGASLGWLIQKAQETFREAGSKAAQYIQECKRTEDLFLGRCLGYQGQPGGSDSQVANSCNDYQGIEVKIPGSYEELGEIVCRVAQNHPQDVQLLWGFTQLEGGPMNDQIAENERNGGTSSTMSCADLVGNSCGASQIAGVIVPQCADLNACPQVDWINNGAAGEAYRKSVTTEVACSVEGALRFVLQTRKGQVAELKEWYREANGTDPSPQQLYYMMAGRNLGVGREYLVKPGCQGADPISGCDGLNYCQCVMDKFTYRCGQSV